MILIVHCNQKFNNEQFHNCLRTFKDPGKYSGTTKCFSRIWDMTSIDSKFKERPWRSRTYDNLNFLQIDDMQIL